MHKLKFIVRFECYVYVTRVYFFLLKEYIYQKKNCNSVHCIREKATTIQVYVRYKKNYAEDKPRSFKIVYV